MSHRKSNSSRKNSHKRKKKIVPEYEGKAIMSRDGFIFVRVEGQEEDIYVKASKTRGALNGDIVRVAVTQEKTGQAKRRSGEVIAIVERSSRPFVGILHIVGDQAWVLMSSKTMPYDISVPIPEGGVKGMKVAAVVDSWERGAAGPSGAGGHPRRAAGGKGPGDRRRFPDLYPDGIQGPADPVRPARRS